jgi:hypothetical protein
MFLSQFNRIDIGGPAQNPCFDSFWGEIAGELGIE